LPKKRAVGKREKIRRRNRQEYARINNLHFEQRQEREVGDVFNDDLTLPLAVTMALLTRRRH